MKTRLKIFIFLVMFTSSKCDEPELPPCPTNIQFLPQSLPMHCRMPREAKLPGLPGAQILQLPPFFQTPPPPDKVPNNLPMPMQMPGMPGPIPGMPGPIPGMPGPIPGMPGPIPGMPGPMSMPMPMMPPGSPASKLPVIVMPFYSPDTPYKNRSPDHERNIDPYRRPKRPLPHYNMDTSSDIDTSSDTSSGSSSDGRGWWKPSKGLKRNFRRSNRRHKPKRRNHGRKDLLTPVLQYVTNDGYVIFEKKITKNEAKDWLDVKKNGVDNNDRQMSDNANDNELQEPTDEDKEDKPASGRRGKTRQELIDMATHSPSSRKHNNRMKMKHRDSDADKEDATRS